MEEEKLEEEYTYFEKMINTFDFKNFDFNKF
jgi:hypothetical protein